jgi:Acyclic terpene utilisation family protein AtuA
MTRRGGGAVRIGCASGFWGDSEVGAPQLVERGAIDYLVFDYLAETTMAILAGARAKRPELGYATDFVDVAMRSVVTEVARRRIKVVANAGGLNPRGCAAALAKLAGAAGVALRIAVVEGDDVSALLPSLRAAGVRDGSTGQPLPERILSANAYLGALPIAQALAAGADVVVTGRCVDSALVLGPLLHELGWTASSHDALAAGSLAGHIVECGCQATGGLFTDWRRVERTWADIGYPIVECRDDGSFVVTKPEGTGGLVAAEAVAEQLVYEIGDPGAYLLPDVTCDFREVRIEPQGPERVRVSGARGLPPTDSYKVSATYVDGFRSSGLAVVVGIEAVAKARRTGEAILERTRGILRRRGLPDYTRANVEVIGGETLYGPHSRARQAREVMLRVTVDHPMKEALEIFSREIAPAGTSWAPGTASPGGGRPSISPLVKQCAFTVPKAAVPIRVVMDADGEARAVTVPLGGGYRPGPPPAEPEADAPAAATAAGEAVPVPLVKLAHARSGDKGNTSNIGVIARRPEYLPVILAQVTPAAVKAYLAHLVKGEVARYLLPGIHACNLVLQDALDGGGPASQRMDPLGKGMAQILLDMPVRVPRELAARLDAEADADAGS